MSADARKLAEDWLELAAGRPGWKDAATWDEVTDLARELLAALDRAEELDEDIAGLLEELNALSFPGSA